MSLGPVWRSSGAAVARAYLGLGSNIGDRRAHLEYAMRQLARHGTVLARSPLMETEPVDCPSGGMFLNACVCLETALAPMELLAAALRIERARGRRRRVCNEPRVLDIDLLLVDEIVLAEAGLTLPHPRMHERRFVLEPMVTIAPGIAHPSLGRPLSELLGAGSAA